MATDQSSGDGGTYDLPSTDEYEQETRKQRELDLPVLELTLPVYHVPPGRIMALIEQYNLAALFGGGDMGDLQDMVSEDGDISMNTFMRTEIVPNVLEDETNKDVIHWNDEAARNDPDVDDFDLSSLEAEDLGALIRGIMLGEEDELPEDQLDKFQG